LRTRQEAVLRSELAGAGNLTAGVTAPGATPGGNARANSESRAVSRQAAANLSRGQLKRGPGALTDRGEHRPGALADPVEHPPGALADHVERRPGGEPGEVLDRRNTVRSRQEGRGGEAGRKVSVFQDLDPDRTGFCRAADCEVALVH